MIDKMNGISSGYSTSTPAHTETKPVQQTTTVKSVDVESSTKQDKDKRAGDLSDDLKRTVKSTIDKVNGDERCKRTGIEFSYHEKSKQISIKLYDKETKEVIKEIPPEKTIEMLEKMWELAGLLVDEKM